MPGTVNSYPPSTARARQRELEREELRRARLAERRADPLGAGRVAVVVEPRMHLDHEPGVVVAVVVEHDVGRRRARHGEAGGLPVVAGQVVGQLRAVEGQLGGDVRLGGHRLAGELVGLGLLGAALVLLGDVAGRVVRMRSRARRCRPANAPPAIRATAASPNVPVIAVREAPRLSPTIAPTNSTIAPITPKATMVAVFVGRPSMMRLNE